MNGPVLSETSGAVTHLTFNRPDQLNAIDTALAEAFEAAVDAALSDGQTRVILMSGAGRAFMAGGDVRGMAEAQDRGAFLRSVIQPMHRAMVRLSEAPVLTIAAVHGAVAGGGMSLALGADFVLASRNARFTMAYAALGASPDCGGSWHLPRLVGRRLALDLTLGGRSLDAEEALALGLVTRIVDDADLMTEAQALAERLATGPAEAQARTVALIDAATNTPLPQQLDAEEAAFLACAETTDFSEGLDAFLTRRAPIFGKDKDHP